MKHIGIVACSAEGAALCYRTICRDADVLVGRHDHPRITMDSIPLAAWMPALDADDWPVVAAIMLDSTRVVAGAGAELAICPDNTVHLAWDLVQAASPIPWLHIAGVAGEEARRLGARRVGVLGTRFTMRSTLYPDALGALGIETLVPDAADADLVDRVIFDELVPGVVSATSRRAFQGVIDRLAARGCDAVALACTEIPLLVRPEDSPLPSLDSTRLLAAAALAAAMDDQPLGQPLGDVTSS